MSKTAVVLFTLGGPDALDSVQPFLFNLFHDKAIIRLPQPLRWLVASLISARRAPITRAIYERIGGRSPILQGTSRQAEELEKQLGDGFKVFTCMRYWHPLSDEVARQVNDYAPERILLLPLYPQFSTTTTASSFADWNQAAQEIQLRAPTQSICCYPTHPLFIASHAAQALRVYDAAQLKSGMLPRILFSAHGLPERVIKGGDPYQWQVEQTAAAIIESMETSRGTRRSGATTPRSEGVSVSEGGDWPSESMLAPLDYIISYQSRVGRLKWIGPSTEEEVIRAAGDGMPIVVVPVAFVSEHSETLDELDIKYKELAASLGCAHYYRVPALSCDSWFIEALADMVLHAPASGVCSYKGERLCPAQWRGCAMNT